MTPITMPGWPEWMELEELPAESRCHHAPVVLPKGANHLYCSGCGEPLENVFGAWRSDVPMDERTSIFDLFEKR